MTSKRIIDHPVLDKLTTSKKISFTFDGKELYGYEHDTIASALLANGSRTLRFHESSGTPRGIYCNIGHCFECRVMVNGVSNIRACLTPIEQNMVIESEKVQPSPLDPNQEGEPPRTYMEFQQWKKKRGSQNE